MNRDRKQQEENEAKIALALFRLQKTSIANKKDEGSLEEELVTAPLARYQYQSPNWNVLWKRAGSLSGFKIFLIFFALSVIFVIEIVMHAR